MTISSYGKKAVLLADGSTLLSKTTFTHDQYTAMNDDLSIINEVRNSEMNTKLAHFAGRVIAVCLLVFLAAAIISESINLILASVLAVALLFSSDFMRVAEKKVQSKCNERMNQVTMFNKVLAPVSGFIFNKPHHEKLAMYSRLILTGMLSLDDNGDYYASLVANESEGYELSVVSRLSI